MRKIFLIMAIVVLSVITLFIKRANSFEAHEVVRFNMDKGNSTNGRKYILANRSDVLLANRGTTSVPEPNISVHPGGISFGTVDVGNTSDYHTLIVSNTGDADLVIEAIVTTGEDIATCHAIGCAVIRPDAFIILRDSCLGQTILPSRICTIDMVYQPTSEWVGPEIAFLSISSNDPDSPSFVALSGSAPHPNFTVYPGGHDYDEINVGSPSSFQVFTIVNTGTADLIIGTITTYFFDSLDFHIQNDNCSNRSIAPGGTCTFNVLFSPTSSGSKMTDLNIPTNYIGPIPVITLRGFGTGIATCLYGDMNHDGEINIIDAILVIRMALEL